MNKYIITLLVVLVAGIFLPSCKKNDYKNDGGPSIGMVNLTTYDYLKSNHLFDSLVKVIDRAGMKDAINGDITFFATTNYGVNEFMQARKFLNGVITGDENSPYSIDSLPANEIADSLKVYIYPGKITRDKMKLEGTLYDCALGPIPDIKFMIKLRRTQDFNAYLDHVDYVTFTEVYKTRDDQEPDPDAIPQEDRDRSSTVQTSNIITTTGVVHVLDGYHRLFFNQGKLGN